MQSVNDDKANVILSQALIALAPTILNDCGVSATAVDNFFSYASNVEQEVRKYTEYALTTEELKAFGSYLSKLAQINLEMRTSMSYRSTESLWASYIQRIDVAHPTLSRLSDLVGMSGNKSHEANLLRMGLRSRNIQSYRVQLPTSPHTSVFVTTFIQDKHTFPEVMLAIYGGMMRTNVVDNKQFKEGSPCNYMLIGSNGTMLLETPMSEFYGTVPVLDYMLNSNGQIPHKKQMELFIQLAMNSRDSALVNPDYLRDTSWRITNALKRLYGDSI